MSDYWSGIFLLAAVVVTIFLLLGMLIMVLVGRRKSRFNIIALGIILLLATVWIIDRILVGYFCLPWECAERNIQIESLLLDNEDLPDDWIVGQTFPYAYVPRSSIAYIERTFDKGSNPLNDDFYQEVYQYSSIRGASFQYEDLKSDLPRQDMDKSQLIFPEVKFRDNHSKKYVASYVVGARRTCYYIAQYDEYVVVLRMPFTTEAPPLEEFVKIVQLVDEKLSISLRISETNTPK